MKAAGGTSPQGSGGWTRRTFLRSFLLGMLAGMGGACRNPGEGTDASQPTALAWLAEVITAPASAARLGRSYLELHPEERDRGRLLAAIEDAVASGGSPLYPASDADQVAAVLQRVLRAEYVRDQVVAVSGWVLSRTEARLYALVSLDAETAVTAAP